MTNKSLLQRSLSTEGELSKEQIEDILFVFKQIVGVIIGVAIGIAGLTGIIGLLAYAAASFVVSYIYVMRFLQPEEDTVETLDIFKSNFMVGLFAFMLPWIITHNLINY